jgi:anti-anti-sigma factor
MIINEHENKLEFIFMRKVKLEQLQKYNEVIEAAAKKGIKEVTADISRLAILDSPLVGVFLKSVNLLKEINGSFLIINPTDQAREVLAQTGLDAIFGTEDGTPGEQEIQCSTEFNNMGDMQVLKILGILDRMECANRLREVCVRNLTAIENLVIDFSETQFIDSMAIGEIVNLRKEMKIKNKPLMFCGMNDIVKEILDKLGFTLIVPFYKDLNEAKKALQTE